MHQLRGERPTVVVTVLDSLYGLVAVDVAQRFQVPLAVIIHDDWVRLSPGASEVERVAITRYQREVLDGADWVWPVSAELANQVGVTPSAPGRILRPIPNGWAGASATWDARHERPTLVYAGSNYPGLSDTLVRVARSLAEVSGRLHVITPGGESASELLAEPNVTLRPPFPTNREALEYIAANATATLIAYPFSPHDTARLATSFPSKLIEYTHLGLPAVIVAPDDSSVARWAVNVGWTANACGLSDADLSPVVHRLANRDGWEAMASQSRRAAEGEFNPSTIHTQFMEDLEQLGTAKRLTGSPQNFSGRQSEHTT